MFGKTLVVACLISVLSVYAEEDGHNQTIGNEVYQIVSLEVAKELIESGTVSRLERVNWTGFKIFGKRFWGAWHPLKTGERDWFGFYAGSDSPYFRLNRNDKTVFRGLGRESDFIQWLFSTSSSREPLIKLMSSNPEAIDYLNKFDKQIKRGERVHRVSRPLETIGKITLTIGAILLPFDLVAKSLAEELGGEDTGLKSVKIMTIGLIMYVPGVIGDIVAVRLKSEAFGLLDSAVDTYNIGQSKKSHTSRLQLSLEATNNELYPSATINFNF